MKVDRPTPAINADGELVIIFPSGEVAEVRALSDTTLIKKDVVHYIPTTFIIR